MLSLLSLVTLIIIAVQLTTASITRLQRIQNQLAGVVCKAPYRSSTTDLLCQLHWLPVTQRIEYKILHSYTVLDSVVSPSTFSTS